MDRRHWRLVGALPALVVLLQVASAAEPDPLPPATSADFCVAVQQRMATTGMRAHNTVFGDLPSYRHSKPSAQPFEIYQYVTHADGRPIMVSCKMKTAAMLRAVYGGQAARAQHTCPDVARAIQAQAVEALRRDNKPAAADKAATFVIDDNEPYLTGYSYLQDFPLSYRTGDGRIHLNSPGLFQDYDAWYTILVPKKLQGQSYCHLATVDYIMALATGGMQPGTVVSLSVDEATR